MSAMQLTPGVRRRGPLARLGRRLLERRFAAPLRELRTATELSPDELRARQEERLRALVRAAAARVPFWREVFRQRGVAAERFTLDDLGRLPVVDKATFRSRPLTDFLAEGDPEWVRVPYATSGSTGEPFRFVLDRRAAAWVGASHLWFDEQYGIEPFDRCIRIMGAPTGEPPAPTGTPLRARFGIALGRWLQAGYERRTVRRFTTFDVDVERFAAALERFRPHYLLGYTSTLALLAEEMLARGRAPREPLKAVITIAETLTPDRRHAIERAFSAPIDNRYGQREFKFWCAQSPPADPTRFLVHPELVVWETLRADGSPCAPGEVGRVVLTNLHNRAMPFLRYETGDRARAAEFDPALGSPFACVARLEGRSVECLRTPSGRQIDPTTLGHHLFVVSGWVDRVRHYQLVATSGTEVCLRVVAAAPLDAAGREHLRRDLLALLGDGVHAEVETVPDIPLESSGKRPIIKLHPDARPES